MVDRVDSRPIEDVRPEDLRGHLRCHFFAGIGGWEYALRLAGWPDDAPVWTGSCPCQPFSCAGKGRGVDDERHVWPIWRDLIAECRPKCVFGEQVASKAGRSWLAGVRADLEALGYGFGAADLCAASIGAPHIRQRLFWVADAGSQRSHWGDRADPNPQGWAKAPRHLEPRSSADGGLAQPQGQQPHGSGTAGNGRPELADGGGRPADASRPSWHGSELRHDPWAHHRIVECRDGKARRISTQPGDEPLAHGVPARVVRLRGYGNAIVPQLAAEFVRAYLETR